MEFAISDILYILSSLPLFHVIIVTLCMYGVALVWYVKLFPSLTVFGSYTLDKKDSSNRLGWYIEFLTLFFIVYMTFLMYISTTLPGFLLFIDALAAVLLVNKISYIYFLKKDIVESLKIVSVHAGYYALLLVFIGFVLYRFPVERIIS